MYVLAEAPRSLEDLDKAVEVPPEIYAVLLGLDSQEADSSYFTQPDAFYTKIGGEESPKSGIGAIKLIPDQDPLTLFNSFISTNLRNNDFEASEPEQQYGGGDVYTVQKQGSTFYLNLVPTQDGMGTLVVVWQNSPN